MKVCFFVNTKSPELINRAEFYKSDIDILKKLGFDIKFCFNYKYIPEDVDFYFVWWWTYAIFPVLKAKLYKKKIVITGTFNFDAKIKGVDYQSRSFFHRAIIRTAAMLSDANIMVSKFEETKMRETITKKNVFYSPHVLDIQKYTSLPLPREKYVFTISWLERINAERKCINEIIQSAAILKKQGINLTFFIAGKIEKSSAFLIKSVRELDLDDTVFFLGKISEQEKLKRLNECGIYLQPTVFEGFGVAIAEAMLTGAPVITSKVGAVPEVTGDHCTYVDGKSPNEIANAIINCFSDYPAALKKGYEGKNYVQENFYFNRRKNDFQKIFKKIGIF